MIKKLVTTIIMCTMLIGSIDKAQFSLLSQAHNDTLRPMAMANFQQKNIFANDEKFAETIQEGLRVWINTGLDRPINTPLDWETINQFHNNFLGNYQGQNEQVAALWKILNERTFIRDPIVLKNELANIRFPVNDAPPILVLAVPNTLVFQVQMQKEGKGLRVVGSDSMCAGTALGAGQALVGLGREVHLLSLVGDGVVGRHFEKLVRQVGFKKIVTLNTAEDTRLWPVIVRENDAFEWRFSAPGPVVSLSEKKALYRAADEAFEGVSPGTFIIMGGKVPLGCNVDLWVDLIQKARSRGLRVFFDNLDKSRSSAELQEILAAGVYLIKPNLDEFATLIGKDRHSFEDNPQVIVKEARQLIKSIRKNGGDLEIVFISRGGKGPILVTLEEAYFGLVPNIIPKNHIGAGDAIVGALAHKLSLGASLKEAFKFALAVATISTQKPGVMRVATLEEAEALAAQIWVTSVEAGRDLETWYVSDLPADIFEFNKEALNIALEYFKSAANIPQLNRILLNSKGINAILWKNGVLSIITDTRVVKLHLKSHEINERLGLKDRFYIRHSDDFSEDISVKIYHRDTRDDIKRSGPVYILGVGRNSHDSGAVLIKDGVVIGAIEEERLNMNKHTRAYFPKNATEYLLNAHGIKWNQIAHIAVTYDYNWFRDTLHSSSPRDHFHNRLGLPGLAADKQKYDTVRLEEFLKQLAYSHGSRYVPPVTFVKHHKAHAAAAWYTSGFPQPTLAITIDGRGEDEASTVWLCADGKMKKISSSLYINSLGHLYHIVTKYLGYKSHDEGKVMGFAPYGVPKNAQEELRVKRLRALMDEVVNFDSQIGQISLNQDYFNFFTLRSFPEMNFSSKFLAKLNKLVPAVSGGMTGRELDPEREEHRPYANLAFVLQEKIEQCVMQMLTYYLHEHPKTKGVKHVVMAGGLSLNIAANGKIIESGIVEPDKFFVPAFPADDGTPVGAALSVADEEYGLKIRNIVEKISLGKTYTEKEIQVVLDRFGLIEGEDYFRVQGNSDLIEKVADTLAGYKTVAWFQGGAELGPRALGNRSILHRLDDPEGNLKVNQIKNREPWRPSALSIQQERASEFLEGIAVSPFMTIGFKVTPEKKDLIRAGVHPADGTTRPQTVSHKANPLYWMLLGEMNKRTGVPGILNTSFNRWGPIVETPEDALNAFYYGDGIDELAIGHFIVRKTGRLQPSVLYARDEHFLKDGFNQARYNGSTAEIWDRFWKAANDLVQRRGVNHQHFLMVSVIDANRKKEVLRVPLCKEMFQSGPREKMIPNLARSIQQRIGGILKASVIIETTAAEYNDIVVNLFEQFTPPEIRERWNIVTNLADHNSPVYLQAEVNSKAWGVGSEKIGEYSWELAKSRSVVKLLTLADSVAPQFHDDKDEILVVTGVDPVIAEGPPRMMVGFSSEAKKRYGEQVKTQYREAVQEYANRLIALITILKEAGYTGMMEKVGKVTDVAREVERNVSNRQISEALRFVERTRGEVDFFYEYMEVDAGDVIIIPKGCLHAAGPGMQIYEAQFPGSIVSLEDMDKFPVRYSPIDAPEWIRRRAKGILDWEKIPQIDDTISAYKLKPKIIFEEDDTKIEELGAFAGVEMRKINQISMRKDAENKVSNTASLHILQLLSGNAKVLIDDEEYDIPKIMPGGEALLIPASVKEYAIISIAEKTEIIDTFHFQKPEVSESNFDVGHEYPNPLISLLDQEIFEFVRDILHDRYSQYGLDISLVDKMLEYALINSANPEKTCEEIYRHVINFPSMDKEELFHKVYFDHYKKEIKPKLLRDLIQDRVTGAVVLDAGAGMSALALGLLDDNPNIKRFISTHNIDYKRVDIADSRMEFVMEKSENGFRISLEEDSVNTVIITGRLHHLYRGREGEFFNEIVRILHPKGKVLVIEDAWSELLSDPEGDEFAGRFRELTYAQKQGAAAFLDWVGTRLIPGPVLIARPWNFKSIEEWNEEYFQKAGLIIVSKEYHGFPTKKFTPLPLSVVELIKADSSVSRTFTTMPMNPAKSHFFEKAIDVSA